MSEYEKISWLMLLLGVVSPAVFTTITEELWGWDYSQGNAGKAVLTLILVWALTLAFRGVYLSGKRKGKGNQ